jgi:hypothetical protein
MKFSLVALLAAASSVVAQTPGFDVLTVPAQGQVLKTGSSFAIQWEPNKVTGTVSITLIQGAAFNLLQKGPVIACARSCPSSLCDSMLTKRFSWH